MNRKGLLTLASVLIGNTAFPASNVHYGFEGWQPHYPRRKPWVEALEAKCRQGATSPSVETRQTRRAATRAADWATHRMEQKRMKVGRQSVMQLRNKSGLTGPRREHREAGRA